MGKRDSCFSKGHGCLAHALLAEKGFISHNDLDTFCRFESVLGDIPNLKIPELTSTVLRSWFANCVGMAIASSLKI